MWPSDFPNELLKKIADFIGFEDMSVTNLAVCCKRFYTTLIPLILDDEVGHLAQMIRDRKFYAEDLDGNPIFSAFVASDLYDIPFRKVTIEVAAIDKDLRCFHRFVVRAKQIDAINLHLDRYSANLPPRSRARKLATIFNSCAERKAELGVFGYPSDWDNEGGPFMFQVIHKSEGVRRSRHIDLRASLHFPSQPRYYKKVPRRLQSTFRRMEELCSRLKESFPGQLTSTSQTVPPSIRVTPRRGRYEVFLLANPRLTSITIATRLPFLASFSRSTFSLLNSSQLTELTFLDLHFSLYEWSYILASISLPRLSYLSLYNIAIAFSDLRKFLTRHDRISSLYLAPQDLGEKFKLPVPGLRRFLPQVEILSGKPIFLIPFLRNLGRFPALSSIDLRLVNQYGFLFKDAFKKDMLVLFFDTLATVNSRGVSLRLDSLEISKIVEWLHGSPEDGVHPRPPRSIPCLRDLNIDKQAFVISPALLAKIAPNNEPQVLAERGTGDEEVVKSFLWKTCPNLETISYSHVLGGPQVTVNRP